MAVIKRGIGFTSTERNLAALADKIFLNLWTYPNLFKSDGKELCDLLVVCGDDVLIFSDKNIAWPKGNDFDFSWSRWYRRAIEELAAQINGAARYLREHPDELFLDAACKEKFPLALPPLERWRVHHIAIALGASAACADHYKEAPGYFPIDPDWKGKSHSDTTADGFMPFAIGDVQPKGAFIHVFNEPALELLARELDTVTDFTRYLTRRERIMRSGHLQPLGGEHELLGQYSLSGGPDEEHDFTRPGGGEWQEGEKLQIPSGTYAGLAAQPGYKARKEADKVSYAWDNLLGQFTASILAGEAEGAFGKEPTPAEAEEACAAWPSSRVSAAASLAPRWSMRCKRLRPQRPITLRATWRRARTASTRRSAMSYLSSPITAKLPATPIPIPQAPCRHVARLLSEHASSQPRPQARNRDRNRRPSKVTGRMGGSEDFYALEVDTWTPELEKRAQELKKDLGLLRPDNVTHGTASVDEFPAIVTVKADAKWPNMWRVHLPNGQVSDMTNLTRAKDAARALSRSG